MEGLRPCPFCSTADLTASDEDDAILQCNSCGESNCRHCHVNIENHDPISCEGVLHFNVVLNVEYQAMERKLLARHEVEEAMTAALLRKCNKCNNRFFTDGGCQRVRCQCGNEQCYVCSETLKAFEYHKNDSFSASTTQLGQWQVAKAQEETIQRLLRVRSDLKEEDIRVEKAENLGNCNAQQYGNS